MLWTSPALRTRDDFRGDDAEEAGEVDREPTTAEVWFSLLPWIIVCVILLMWGTGAVKGILNPCSPGIFRCQGLHNMINKVPPVVPQPTQEGAVFSFTYLSFTGSGMLIAAIISGLLMGFTPVRLVKAYGETIRICAYSLITISAMLAIGTLTRLSGVDATLGLAFAGTGRPLSVLRHFARLVGRGADRARIQRQTCCSATCRRSRREQLGLVRRS